MLVCVLVIAACGREAAPEKRGGIRVKDDVGNLVVLEKPAERIASLAPAYTEILFAVGCGDRIVLRDENSDYPEAVRSVPFTDGMMLPAEHILSFKPDLVLAYQTSPPKLDPLSRAGCAVASFDPTTLDQVMQSIARIGALCGSGQPAERLAQSMTERIQHVTSAVSGQARPLVYAEVDGSDPSRPWTAGPGSLVDELIALAGGRNLAASIGRPWGVISVEEIIRRNPDVILRIGATGSASDDPIAGFRDRPGWSGLAAITGRRIIVDIPEALLSRPGPRLVDGLEALAKRLHPKAFGGS